MTSNQHTNSFSKRVGVFLLTGLALLAFLATQRGVGRAQKMKVEPATSAQLAQFKPGEAIKVVLDLTRTTPAASAEGWLLEKQSETVYRRSATAVNLRFDANTPVVMGKTADVHRNAVVHVSGTIGKDRTLTASQIVILTGYVQVQ